MSGWSIVAWSKRLLILQKIIIAPYEVPLRLTTCFAWRGRRNRCFTFLSRRATMDGLEGPLARWNPYAHDP